MTKAEITELLQEDLSDAKNFARLKTAIMSTSGFDNYTEVDIDSSQMLDIFNTPVEVLPVLTGTQYYSGVRLVVEFNSTTPYNYRVTFLTLSGLVGGALTTNDLAGSVAFDMILTGLSLGTAISLSSNTDYSYGAGGSMKVKLWYEIREKGTEL